MSDPARLATIVEVQQYWDRRPCNIKHSKKEIGSKEYFDEVEARKYMVEPHIPKFADFPRWKNRRVLEVGCGIGTDAINFTRHGAIYTAVELSKASLDITKARFDIYGLEGEFYHLNGEELSHSLDGKKYDLIYSFGVIHHSPNPRAVISEVRKLISPDGELRIMLYAKNSWKSAMISAGLDQPEAQTGCPIALTYDQRDIEDLLEGLFEPICIEQDHIFPYQIEKYLNYEYIRQPWFEVMSDELFKALERKLGWHILIKAKPILR